MDIHLELSGSKMHIFLGWWVQEFVRYKSAWNTVERAQHQTVVADRWIHFTTTMMMRDDVTTRDNVLTLCHKLRTTTKE
jgi:hypothetical protein